MKVVENDRDMFKEAEILLYLREMFLAFLRPSLSFHKRIGRTQNYYNTQYSHKDGMSRNTTDIFIKIIVNQALQNYEPGNVINSHYKQGNDSQI